MSFHSFLATWRGFWSVWGPIHQVMWLGLISWQSILRAFGSYWQVSVSLEPFLFSEGTVCKCVSFIFFLLYNCLLVSTSSQLQLAWMSCSFLYSRNWNRMFIEMLIWLAKSLIIWPCHWIITKNQPRYRKPETYVFLLVYFYSWTRLCACHLSKWIVWERIIPI